MTFTEKMLRAAAKVYATDASAPGIVISWLSDKKEWYASLQRYPDGETKRLAAKAYSRIGVDHVVMILAATWGNNKKAHPMALKLASFRCVAEAIKQAWDLEDQQ